jgi:hypothetical protein
MVGNFDAAGTECGQWEEYMTHPFSILWEAMPKEDREEVDREVAIILAELDRQEQQHAAPPQREAPPVKQPLIAAHA